MSRCIFSVYVTAYIFYYVFGFVHAYVRNKEGERLRVRDTKERDTRERERETRHSYQRGHVNTKYHLSERKQQGAAYCSDTHQEARICWP